MTPAPQHTHLDASLLAQVPQSHSVVAGSTQQQVALRVQQQAANIALVALQGIWQQQQQQQQQQQGVAFFGDEIQGKSNVEQQAAHIDLVDLQGNASSSINALHFFVMKYKVNLLVTTLRLLC
jgi:hypothetical protein